MNEVKKEIEKEEIKAGENMNDLTFLDGVLVTWNIFNKILDKRLRDENGNPKKDMCNGHSYDYLGIINDDIAEFILDNVLEHGYFKNRGEKFIDQFEINESWKR